MHRLLIHKIFDDTQVGINCKRKIHTQILGKIVHLSLFRLLPVRNCHSEIIHLLFFFHPDATQHWQCTEVVHLTIFHQSFSIITIQQLPSQHKSVILNIVTELVESISFFGQIKMYKSAWLTLSKISLCKLPNHLCYEQ